MRLSPGDQQPSPPPPDWRGALERASTGHEVVTIVREYLATWSPGQIASLPAACRPPRRMRDADAITQWAFELATTHCAPPPGIDEHVLLRMLVFVTQASLRLSQVKAADQDAAPL